MITRYSRPDAVAIWSQETKYKIWFEIEAHAATKMAELGVIPNDAELTAPTEWLPEWDDLTDDDRKVSCRLAETYAAFASHTDHQVGRLDLGGGDPVRPVAPGAVPVPRQHPLRTRVDRVAIFLGTDPCRAHRHLCGSLTEAAGKMLA